MALTYLSVPVGGYGIRYVRWALTRIGGILGWVVAESHAISSDYRDIDPQYGTLADWDSLLKGVHERGMKLMCASWIILWIFG